MAAKMAVKMAAEIDLSCIVAQYRARMMFKVSKYGFARLSSVMEGSPLL